MRFNRFATATAAALLTLGTTAVVPTLAGAQDTTTTTVPAGPQTADRALSCYGADAATQEQLNGFGGLPLGPGGTPLFPTDGTNYYVPMTAQVVSTVPGALVEGETSDVSFTWQIGMPQSLVDLALGVPLTSMTLSDIDTSIVVSGGGEGGPYVASPTSIEIVLDPLNVPLLTAAGEITVTDAADPIYYSLNNFRGTIVVPLGEEPLSLALNCEPNEPIVASTGGTVPTPPPVVTPTNSGTSAVAADPAYTG